MAYYKLEPQIPSHSKSKPITHYINTDEDSYGHGYYRIQLMYDVDEVHTKELTEAEYLARRRKKSD